jgi:hypothetical protein
LLWRQAGGVVTQKSPDVSRSGSMSSGLGDPLGDDRSSKATAKTGTSSTTSSVVGKPHDKDQLSEEEVKKGGCGACCIIQ